MLYETYHGVFINIQYFLKVEMKRGLLAKDVEKSCEFIVEYLVSFNKLNCLDFFLSLTQKCKKLYSAHLIIFIFYF